MSNKGLCWECTKREKCSLFKKDPDAVTKHCGRFTMQVSGELIAELYKGSFHGQAEVGT